MKRLTVGVCLVVLLAVFACGQRVMLLADMTPQEKATVAMQIYLGMRASYEERVALPSLSEAEKEVLQGVRNLLTSAGPKIKAYNEMVKGNQPIDEAVVTWVESFLRQYRY